MNSNLKNNSDITSAVYLSFAAMPAGTRYRILKIGSRVATLMLEIRDTSGAWESKRTASQSVKSLVRGVRAGTVVLA